MEAVGIENMDIQRLENIFKKCLKEYQNDFGFVCFFGSLNLNNDLDVFVAPSNKIKKGYFLKQLISFLEKIRMELLKEKKDILIIWHSTYEEEVKMLNTKKDALKIHVSSFPDIQPTTIPNYLINLQKNNKILLGDYKAIDKIRKTKLDYFYNYLFISNCLLSNYPENLEREKISFKVNYVYKNLIGMKKELEGSPKKIFFECCDFLDEH